MTESHLTVSRVVAATPAVVFAVLSDPRRHADLDGSGMVRGDVDAAPVTEVGQVFRMRVHHPAAGDYETDNHVSRFERDALLAWRTSAVDAEPAGWEWVWRLSPVGEGSTEVSLTYDWSGVRDPAVLAILSFPVVPPEALAGTLDRLVAAVTA